MATRKANPTLVLADVRDRLVGSLAQRDRVDDHERPISQPENRLPS